MSAPSTGDNWIVRTDFTRREGLVFWAGGLLDNLYRKMERLSDSMAAIEIHLR